MPKKYSFPEDILLLRQEGYEMAQAYFTEARSLTRHGYSEVATLATRLLQEHEIVLDCSNYFERFKAYLKDMDSFEEPRSIITRTIKREGCCVALAKKISSFGSDRDQEVFNDFYKENAGDSGRERKFLVPVTESPEMLARRYVQNYKKILALYSNDYKGNPECARWLAEILRPEENLAATLEALQNFPPVNMGSPNSSVPVLKL